MNSKLRQHKDTTRHSTFFGLLKKSEARHCVKTSLRFDDLATSSLTEGCLDLTRTLLLQDVEARTYAADMISTSGDQCGHCPSRATSLPDTHFFVAFFTRTATTFELRTLPCSRPPSIPVSLYATMSR